MSVEFSFAPLSSSSLSPPTEKTGKKNEPTEWTREERRSPTLSAGGVADEQPVPSDQKLSPPQPTPLAGRERLPSASGFLPAYAERPRSRF